MVAGRADEVYRHDACPLWLGQEHTLCSSGTPWVPKVDGLLRALCASDHIKDSEACSRASLGG